MVEMVQRQLTDVQTYFFIIHMFFLDVINGAGAGKRMPSSRKEQELDSNSDADLDLGHYN